MATLQSREDLKEYCLRKLGFPVIEINVDDDQLEDRIDEALQFWQDYHFDALEKLYTKHVVTQDDIDNAYITVPANIIGITRILPLDQSNLTPNMWDIRYQLRLNELYDFTSASYINYSMTMQHIRTLELLFQGETPIRFQRHQRRLYVDWSWQRQVVGTIMIIECYGIIDPVTFPYVWNDRFLKKYTTALFKKQWGSNMAKFQGVQLPGGVMLNGTQIFKEAMDEIEELEKIMKNDNEAPLEWFLG